MQPRCCLDGSNRQPQFILPSVSDRLKRELPVDGLALVCALWCRYCHGETESGDVNPPNDADWPRLQERAIAARVEPTKWLEMSDIFGDIAVSATYSTGRFSWSLCNLYMFFVPNFWRISTCKTT